MSRYCPEVFDVPDEATARAIILTPEGSTTEERWQCETPYVGGRLAQLLEVQAGNTVIDFGCGIGRVAKDLISRTGCRVIGVDISPKMRELAIDYVASARFEALSPEQFEQKRLSGWRADCAYTCWVLQHCMDPAAEIARIAQTLYPAAHFAVLNSSTVQAIPTDEGWTFHSIDMREVLRSMLAEVTIEHLPLEVAPRDLAETSFLGLYITPARHRSKPGLWSRLKQAMQGT